MKEKLKFFFILLFYFLSFFCFSNEYKINDLIIKEYEDKMKYKYSEFYKLHFVFGNKNIDLNNYFEIKAKKSIKTTKFDNLSVKEFIAEEFMGKIGSENIKDLVIAYNKIKLSRSVFGTMLPVGLGVFLAAGGLSVPFLMMTFGLGSFYGLEILVKVLTGFFGFILAAGAGVCFILFIVSFICIFAVPGYHTANLKKIKKWMINELNGESNNPYYKNKESLNLINIRLAIN